MKAQLTLEAINYSLEADQGNAYRRIFKEVVAEALALPGAAVFKDNEDGYSRRLGASSISGHCEREMWLNFRWCTQQRASGQMVRLFNRGHLEELRFITMMKMIGCQVWERQNGKQFSIKGYRGHGGGSLDCVVKGVPDAPSVAMPGEFKTHSEKSFATLKKDGLLKSLPNHVDQTLLYMGEYKFHTGLYLACNKNTDELYAELVIFDEDRYVFLKEREQRIIDAPVPAVRISTNPGWFRCKTCGQHGVCHGRAPVFKSCRSCVHVQLKDNGEWLCGEYGHFLSYEEQKSACDDWDPINEIKA